jgi:hypothetical protein
MSLKYSEMPVRGARESVPAGDTVRFIPRMARKDPVHPGSRRMDRIIQRRQNRMRE